MSMLILRQGRNDGMTTFFKFSTNFIRHISTSMTSWQKIFCMRIAHNQYASHTKTWPNAYGYLWRLGQKTSERGQKWRSFRHNSSPNESIMTGPILKFLEFEVLAACKVWTKSNGWNAKSPYLPLLLGSYPLRHVFWARQRVPSRPRRLLVGFCPDHRVEERLPFARNAQWLVNRKLWTSIQVAFWKKLKKGKKFQHWQNRSQNRSKNKQF